MTPKELTAIAERLERGCPSKGVTLSPWAEELQRDAFALLAEIDRLNRLKRRPRK
jgi:hypothetical protein